MAIIMKKNKKLSKSFSPTTINFNGVTLVKEKTKLATFYEDNISEFMEILVRGESNYPETQSHNGDDIFFHRNGTIRVEGVDYLITEQAFHQILSYLGVPSKFALRVSPGIFIDLVNKMLSEHYDKSFFIKTIANLNPKMIIGFHPERKMPLPTAHNLFSHLLRDNEMQDRNTSFIAGVADGQTYAMYLVFDDDGRFEEQTKDTFKGNRIWPGVEILFSPIWNVKPTVTACILGENFAALDKNNASRLDLKKTGMNKVAPVIETFVRNIRHDNTDMINIFEKSFSTEITEEVNSFIHRRIPKVINGGFSDTSYAGMNAAKALGKIHDCGVNNTLSERRKTLFFIWDILKEL
jgi:hypothetical protein